MNLLCAALILLRPMQGGSVASDSRLKQLVSSRHEIISLNDLVQEFSTRSGVPLRVRKSIGDRKVTIVFQEKPLREVMGILATDMLMSWRPVSNNGFELGLTDQEAIDERKTAAIEADEVKQDLDFSLAEIRRLAAMDNAERTRESNRLEQEIKSLANPEATEDSFHLKQLKRSYTALHMAPGLEVTGQSVLPSDVTADSLLEGNPCFASLSKSDSVPHLDPDAIGLWANSLKSVDIVGVTTLTESLRLQTDVLFTAQGGGQGSTRGMPWPIFRAATGEATPLEKAMLSWSKAPDESVRARLLKTSISPAPQSEYASKMYGRAEHLMFIADQTGLPIVADAFRFPLMKAAWLQGKTLGEWLDAYRSATKSTIYKSSPEYLRVQDGWLMFRKDHWWQRLDKEIPESVLQPLEAHRRVPGTPLPVDDYLRLVLSITPLQCEAIGQRGDGTLVKFPVGNFSASYQGLRVFALLNADERKVALSDEGVDLATANSEVQAAAYKALLQEGIHSKDVAVLRALFPGSGFLRGFKFYALDNSESTADRQALSYQFRFGTDPASNHHLQFEVRPETN